MSEEKSLQPAPKEEKKYFGMYGEVAFPLFYTIGLAIIMAIASNYIN